MCSPQPPKKIIIFSGARLDVGPLCQAQGMDELCVSASDFRVHLKDLANAVAAGRQRVLVSRHAYPMVALVSQEDLAFLRKHRPGIGAAERQASGIPDVLEHPESMPFEEVERLYRVPSGTTESQVERWREKAWLHIKLRTGKFPDEMPWSWKASEGTSDPGAQADSYPKGGRLTEAKSRSQRWGFRDPIGRGPEKVLSRSSNPDASASVTSRQSGSRPDRLSPPTWKTNRRTVPFMSP